MLCSNSGAETRMHEDARGMRAIAGRGRVLVVPGVDAAVASEAAVLLTHASLCCA